jgi:hypothetical protein
VKHRIVGIVTFIILAALSTPIQTRAADAGEPPVPDFPPPMVVGDMFQFTEGAWAEYDILDKNEQMTYILRISILEQEAVRRTWFSRRRMYRWLEFQVQMPDHPHVVVKYLGPETPEGPGEPHEMIVQIEEYEDPIRFGRMWLRDNDEQIVTADYEWSDQRVDEETITHAGRTFSAWRAQATADDGTTVEAIVSEELPPFGLYFAENSEQRMTLRDWGMGARTAITGEPVGLFRWITRQVQAAMEEE